AAVEGLLQRVDVVRDEAVVILVVVTALHALLARRARLLGLGRAARARADAGVAAVGAAVVALVLAALLLAPALALALLQTLAAIGRMAR
ncbi:hypothetical protein NL439_25730, partial [Klebsiella pneumoniae]|nr:hypothetical protein [Klebsiella pneumoniae]